MIGRIRGLRPRVGPAVLQFRIVFQLAPVFKTVLAGQPADHLAVTTRRFMRKHQLLVRRPNKLAITCSSPPWGSPLRP
jgi:hypothetical protein